MLVVSLGLLFAAIALAYRRYTQYRKREADLLAEYQWQNGCICTSPFVWNGKVEHSNPRCPYHDKTPHELYEMEIMAEIAAGWKPKEKR